MAKTIEEIKDEVAKKYGHLSWSAVKVKCFKDSISGSSDMEAFMNEVCVVFANSKLKQAAEQHRDTHMSLTDYENAKQSILNLREEV